MKCTNVYICETVPYFIIKYNGAVVVFIPSTCEIFKIEMMSLACISSAFS